MTTLTAQYSEPPAEFTQLPRHHRRWNKGSWFPGLAHHHIEFVFLKSQWMLVHFVKWIRSLLAYGEKKKSPQNPPSPKFGLMASGIVHWKTYCIWNTICAIRFYNVKYIHIPTNLWQEWNHAPSKNSNHIQKIDSVEKDSSTKPQRILTWLLFILSLRSSTEHLKLFFRHFW